MPAKRGVVQHCVRREMEAREQSYRLYNCARCAKQVRICRRCDRGHRYCANGCARERRRESLRRARQRYQQSYRGACQHAARQRAWRARHGKKVTDQGSLGPAVAAIVVPDAITAMSEERHVDTRSFAARAGQERAPQPRCCFCGEVLAPFARLGWLRARR